MLDNPPTGDTLGPQDDLRRGYKQWEERHCRIMQEPPTEGRDYINHALNIFPFIEVISEVHPIAKGVISGFKAVLSLEQIREENEKRVAAVFLAGTDTMRMFFDISEVVTSYGYRSTLHPLNYNSGFETVLLRIRATINECGNSVDAYYKQKRVAKFYRAHEWKARMSKYIDDFKDHREQLQHVLCLYTASNVKVLVTKMSDLVSRLSATEPDWEKTLATQTQNLGDRSGWLESEDSLQAIASAVEDSVVGGTMTKKVKSESNEMCVVQSTQQLSELRDELELSLDEFCSRNMNIFELKLAFHTQQLQDAITSSAQFVVRTLSGPHDRLLHEDLRELWKEMSWIFCVDNKLFSSALSEYYVDRLSVSQISTPDSDSEANKERRNSSKADAWTLNYFSSHGQKITSAIDRDNSGFIRIREANAFTNRIPNGWSLPQWCAYTVAGWSYECHIYRKRMHRLMFKLMEMQAQVLPNNRVYLLSLIEQCHPIYAPLAREPRGQQLPPTTIELRSLVKDKVLSQDAALRTHLETLQWNIEDESVLRLIYGDMPLEKYVLQLSTLVLEQSLILAEISCKLTLDAKEWERFLCCQLTIRKVVLARVRTLSKNFAKTEDAMEGTYGLNMINPATRNLTSELDPKTCFDGLWSSVDLEIYKTYREDYPIDYTSSEIADYHHDLSLLDDFPLPSLEGDPRKHLKYIPWEEHIKSMDGVGISLAIPDEWDPVVTVEGGSAHRAYWARFPFTGTDGCCDVCQPFPLVERYYGCLTCEPMFDLCASCYNEGPPTIQIVNHTVDHPMVKWTLNPRMGQRQWIDCEANAVLEDLRTGVRVRSKEQDGDRTRGSDSSEDDDDYYDGEGEGEEEGEGENEEEGGNIAAGAAIAAELGLDIDGTDTEAGAVSPFPDNDTMEYLNQDAEETATSNEAKDKDKEDKGGNEEEGGVIAAGAAVATGLGLDVDETDRKVGEVPPFLDDETMENQNQNAEETEAGNQAKDKNNSVDGGEAVVQGPVAPPRSFKCARCSDGIDLDSTFYRCIGHSCRDVFICRGCESIPRDSDANDDHKWWHCLLVLRKSLIEPVLETAFDKAETTVTQAEAQIVAADFGLPRPDDSAPDTNPHYALISAVEDKFHVALTAVEDKVDSTKVALEGQLGSIEERVVKLDKKITDLTTMLGDLIGQLNISVNLDAGNTAVDDRFCTPAVSEPYMYHDRVGSSRFYTNRNVRR